MTKIHTNKPDAARRHIDMAVGLLFAQEDPVPIHTLAMAAFRVLSDLIRAKGLEGKSIIGRIDAIIPPELEKSFWGHLYGAANFFKHADRNPDDILDDRDERINDAVLWMAVMQYVELGYTATPEMLALSSWFAAINPDLMLDDHPLKQRASMFDWLPKAPRHEQLEFGQTLLEQYRVGRTQSDGPPLSAP